MKQFVFCGVVAALLPLLMPAQAQPLPAPSLLASTRPLVIGHRGYPSLAPENSLASFDIALKAGVDLVELDYHHSQEGTPVVIHDGTLDRTTDALQRWGGKDLPVVQRPVRDLVGLDVGSWFKPSFAGERLPTLEAALDFIQPRGTTLIERKGGDAATLAQMLRRKSLVNRVVVQSFDWDFLRAYRALDPAQILGALGPAGSRQGRKLTDAEKELSSAWLDEVRATGAQIAVWNRQVNRAAVDDAHSRGLRVWVYTINDEAEAQRLLALGVDGLITDHPALLWKALALRAHAAPSTPRPR